MQICKDLDTKSVFVSKRRTPVWCLPPEHGLIQQVEIDNRSTDWVLYTEVKQRHNLTWICRLQRDTVDDFFPDKIKIFRPAHPRSVFQRATDTTACHCGHTGRVGGTAGRDKTRLVRLDKRRPITSGKYWLELREQRSSLPLFTSPESPQVLQLDSGSSDEPFNSPHRTSKYQSAKLGFYFSVVHRILSDY